MFRRNVMNTNRQLYDQLCDPLLLEDAWIDACDFAPAAGVPRYVLLDYERFLAFNLKDLAARLRDGNYQTAVPAEIGTDGERAATRRRLEDLILQQAIHTLLARQFVPHSVAGGFGGDQPEEVGRAVARVLAQRACGANIFIGLELAYQPPEFAPELLLSLLTRRVPDQRLHRLLWQLFTPEDSPSASLNGMGQDADKPRLFTQLGNSLAVQAGEALSRLGTALQNGQWLAPSQQAAGRQPGLQQHCPDPKPPLAWRPLMKTTLKQFGRDAVLTALSSSTLARAAGLRPERLFTKKSLAATGALLLANAAFPAALEAIRGKFIPPAAGTENWPDQPFSILLVTLALQEFDAAMLRTGLPLTRCGNRLALTARGGQMVQPVLQYIARELGKIGFSLRLDKTFVRRFDQGVEFFGYRFHEKLIAATPSLLALSECPSYPKGR
jgi:hypothetical protein